MLKTRNQESNKLYLPHVSRMFKTLRRALRLKLLGGMTQVTNNKPNFTWGHKPLMTSVMNEMIQDPDLIESTIVLQSEKVNTGPTIVVSPFAAMARDTVAPNAKSA
mmetsp:Transcript_37270/g.107662  ORF Transcript_37270/g.107662 Transcript_37270/m.107662 type:complete len:106 (+) Transcript_37270:130-447(+)